MESSGVHYHIRRIGPGGHMCGKVFGRPCKGMCRAGQDHTAAVADPNKADYKRFLQEAAEDELFDLP